MNTILMHRALYWFIILGILLFLFLLLQPKTSGQLKQWFYQQHATRFESTAAHNDRHGESA